MSRKTTVVSDYGGMAHNRGEPYVTERTKANTLSFRCRDCKTLRFVTRRELNRAARPRCLRCGGPLEETKETHDRRLDQQQALEMAKSGVHGPVGKKGRHPCGVCHAAWPDARGLGGHLRRSTNCRRQYILNGWWGMFESRKVLRGTAYSMYGWCVSFLTIEGEEASKPTSKESVKKKVIREIAKLFTEPTVNQAAGGTPSEE